MDSVVLGALLFVSVSIGACIAWIVAKLFNHSNGSLELLCGGFLVGLLILEVIPSVFRMYTPFGNLLGVLLGYLFFLLLHRSFHRSNSSSIYILSVALLIHTIPISMTTGNLLGDPALGVTIATSTILHHLPEGFALTSVALSKGDRLGGLVLCFIGLSVCFTLFVWIGHHSHLNARAQSVLVGVSIGLIACTSIKEFILQYIRAVPLRVFFTYVVMGYLLSSIFHYWL
jgi:ZIP family zinc transporter